MKIFTGLINKVGGIHISLSLFGKVTKHTVASILMIAGVLGLVVSYLDPMPYMVSLFPIIVTSTISIAQADVQSILTFLNAYILYTIAASIGMVIIGLVFNVYNIKDAPMGMIRLPMKIYRRLVIGRNWLLAKINYLNEESAKWKTLFKILMSPYSFLRAMGFSPQMALGLLAVGSTAGTGVVVNETLLADRSFKNGDAGVYAAPVDNHLLLLKKC